MNTSPNKKASTIYIEIHGGIGEGKSYTLSHIQSIVQKFNLQKICDYYFIPEPIELIGPLLTKYYKNNTHALALQASCFVYYFQELHKLHRQFERELQDGKFNKPKVVFLDRSLMAGKRVFLPILEGVGAVKELEASVLHSIADELIDVLAIPEKDIYRFALVGAVKQGQKNIHYRARKNEEYLSLNYLQQISEMHFNWASLLDSQLNSHKMVFCRSQNEMLMKIIKILGRQHPIPAKINWYIASKRPSDIWPSGHRVRSQPESNNNSPVPETSIAEQAELSPKISSELKTGQSCSPPPPEDFDINKPTKSTSTTSLQPGPAEESYDEVD